MIKRFPLNERGRDFVVGDIHGCFPKLRQSLHGEGFNRKVDRLFSVGDLVDRGDESEQCIQFLQKPWFHPIMGNHELMAIMFADGEWNAINYVQNGGGWFYDLNPESRQVYLDYFKQLPLVIEVETKHGLVGIIHAECLVPTWEQFKGGLLSDYSTDTYKDMCLWGRDRITNHNVELVAGVDKIFCGHTPVNVPVVYGNHYYIDTGACFGDRELTIVEIS